MSISTIFSMLLGSISGEVILFSTARHTPSDVWMPMAVDPNWKEAQSKANQQRHSLLTTWEKLRKTQYSGNKKCYISYYKYYILYNLIILVDSSKTQYIIEYTEKIYLDGFNSIFYLKKPSLWWESVNSSEDGKKKSQYDAVSIFKSVFIIAFIQCNKP